MRDPKTIRDAIIMEQIEIINGDLYDIPSRHINNNVLVIHLKGATEIYTPIVLATQDCDEEEKEILDIKINDESKINKVFRATSEATEEAILNSLICSDTTIGRSGHKVYSLASFFHEF